MVSVYRIVLVVLVICLGACSRSMVKNIPRSGLDERYLTAVSYLGGSSQVASFCNDVFGDSSMMPKFTISDSVVPLHLAEFNSYMVRLKYGLINGVSDRDEYIEHLMKEMADDKERVKGSKTYRVNELSRIYNGEEGNMELVFSEIRSDVMQNRDVLIAQVDPIYKSDEHRYALRDQGVATGMSMRFLFIFNAEAIDTVFSSVLTN